MSRNGSGIYSLAAGNPVVTATTVSSTWANGTLTDIASALTTSIASDGQTVISANIPMNSKKITGLAAPTVAGDALSFGAVATLTALTTTGNTILGDASTDTLNVGNGDLVKDASGNVGINTTNMLSKLNVNNSYISVGSSANTSQTNILLQGYGFSNSATIYGNTSIRSIYANGDNSASLEFYTASSGTNTAERMRIASNGIITMSAYGAGAATFSAAGVISSVSDETWKIKDGSPTNPDDMIQNLTPGYWFYNDEKKEIFGKERQLGFYAQNVNQAIGVEAAPIPETYTELDENGTEITKTKPWGYYDRSVLAVTVMSLQKALTTIQKLKAIIDTQQTQITALNAKVGI